MQDVNSSKIFLGKGNIFDVEQFGFDGIGVIFYKRHGFGPETFGFDLSDYYRASKTPVPICVYYNEAMFIKQVQVKNYYDGRNPKVDSSQLRDLVFRMLSYLVVENGCKKIGFHGAPISDGTYAEGARLTFEAVKEWINIHPNLVDSITLVDKLGDYEKILEIDG